MGWSPHGAGQLSYRDDSFALFARLEAVLHENARLREHLDREARDHNTRCPSCGWAQGMRFPYCGSCGLRVAAVEAPILARLHTGLMTTSLLAGSILCPACGRPNESRLAACGYCGGGLRASPFFHHLPPLPPGVPAQVPKNTVVRDVAGWVALLGGLCGLSWVLAILVG